MRVLFLGRADSPVLAHLREVEAGVAWTRRRLHGADPRVRWADFLVSHGYLHRVPPGVLKRLHRGAINLHNALLPWNRGLDAILWSFAQDTPKGVTIHHMDAGIDTGDIIAQREVRFEGTETLRTAFRRLDQEMLGLFREHWPAIRTGDCRARPQPVGGSYHFGSERGAVDHLLTDGWDTPVSALTRQPAAAVPPASSARLG
jgi:methionyl-tRNA formyltransferase